MEIEIKDRKNKANYIIRIFNKISERTKTISLYMKDGDENTLKEKISQCLIE